MYYLWILSIAMFVQQKSFKETQLAKPRVKSAYEEKEADLKKTFADKQLRYEGFHIFLRSFKQERKLEVWIREKGKTTYTHFHTFDFCAISGTLGPKRKEGDLQIPEGIYHINHFNPESNFHLSLGINYPNASDQILSDKELPGSAIYIHGGCATVGCIPITDDKIKDLYVLAIEARNNGQEKIPVHIFPSVLNDATVHTLNNNHKKNTGFWKNLRPVYEYFERYKVVPKTRVRDDGTYVITSSSPESM